MSSEWPLVRLENITSRIGDGLHGTPKYDDNGDYYFINGNNLSNGRIVINEKTKRTDKEQYLKHKKDLNDRTIFVSINGTLGNIATYREEKIILGKSACYLNVLPEVDKDYIKYVLTSKHFQDYIHNLATGSTIKNVGLKLIRGYEFRLPELAVQKEVSNILNAIDFKIANNTQANQTLEQIAQAIFKSWFVDFDPVKAKMETLTTGGSADDAELAAMGVISAKTLDELNSLKANNPEAFNKLAQTAALFPAAMQDSELGEIPEGWNATPFGELLEKTIGGDWGKEALDEKHTKKVRILRGTDLPNVHSGNDSGVPVRYVNKKKLQTRQLQDGDIVIEVSGGSPTQPTGRSLFISQKILDGLKEPAEPASFCRLFRPLNVKLGLLLSCHLTKIYSDGKTWLYQNQSTGISNFQTKVFLEKELVVDPDAGVLDAFIHNIRPFFDRIHSGESKKLSALRDTLLPELLSGNCPISTVEEV